MIRSRGGTDCPVRVLNLGSRSRCDARRSQLTGHLPEMVLPRLGINQSLFMSVKNFGTASQSRCMVISISEDEAVNAVEARAKCDCQSPRVWAKCGQRTCSKGSYRPDGWGGELGGEVGGVSTCTAS